jgi:hypothetical protein
MRETRLEANGSEKPAAEGWNETVQKNGWNGGIPYFLHVSIMGGGIAKPVVKEM